MMKMKKILLAILTITLVCVTSICAFGASTSGKTYLGIEEEQYLNFVDTIESRYLTADMEKLEYLEHNSTGFENDAFVSLRSIKDALGTYESTDKNSVVIDANEKENSLTIKFKSTFEKAYLNTTVSVKLYKGDQTPVVTGISFTQEDKAQAGFGAKMGKAAINTLMGMGTVFIVLIFISFLISLFKYLPALFDKKSKQPVVSQAPTVAAPVVNDYDEEECEDDTELVAVISAAIAAADTETAADGFVVRTIRKRR